jgi:hypothetical protein
MTELQTRNIDIAIAEKVMGAKIIPDPLNVRGCYEEYTPSLQPGNVQWRDLQHYTTDPVASKALREKLAKTGTWCLSIDDPPRNQPQLFTCTFTLYGKTFYTDEGGGQAEADTEELAVALCALKAYGIEVPA